MYVSAIQTEALMIELDHDSPAAKEVWRGEPKNAVHCSNSTPAFVDGVIYGTDCITGALIAVDGKNGDRLWETFAATKPDEKRFVKHGTAFITRVGDSDRYLLMSETGDLILASLTASGYQEHGRFHAVEPTGECFGRKVVWSYPAYAEPHRLHPKRQRNRRGRFVRRVRRSRMTRARSWCRMSVRTSRLRRTSVDIPWSGIIMTSQLRNVVTWHVSRTCDPRLIRRHTRQPDRPSHWWIGTLYRRTSDVTPRRYLVGAGTASSRLMISGSNCFLRLTTSFSS